MRRCRYEARRLAAVARSSSSLCGAMLRVGGRRALPAPGSDTYEADDARLLSRPGRARSRPPGRCAAAVHERNDARAARAGVVGEPGPRAAAARRAGCGCRACRARTLAGAGQQRPRAAGRAHGDGERPSGRRDRASSPGGRARRAGTSDALCARRRTHRGWGAPRPTRKRRRCSTSSPRGRRRTSPFSWSARGSRPS